MLPFHLPCSCWCGNTIICTMVVRDNLLHRCWPSGTWILRSFQSTFRNYHYILDAHVFQESPGLFKRYVQFHLIALLVAFSVAIAWIIISATRHSTAQSNCLKNFFDNDTTNSEGTTLCNIFPWVDVGIMGGLWVVLAILQVGARPISFCAHAHNPSDLSLRCPRIVQQTATG